MFFSRESGQENNGVTFILDKFFLFFLKNIVLKGRPQYHPPEADKSAEATPVKYAALSFGIELGRPR